MHAQVALAIVLVGCGRDEPPPPRPPPPPIHVAPARPPGFTWRDAFADVIGPQPATLGRLFDGLVLGKPMPADVAARIATWQTTTKGRVHYDAGDQFSLPSLEINLDHPEGLAAYLATAWREPTRDGLVEWMNTTQHLRADLLQNERESGISFSEGYTIDELILPLEPERLGIEPMPLIGAKLADVQAALGGRLRRSAEDGYDWQQPTLAMQLEVRGDRIVRATTQNWITNTERVKTKLIAALRRKWGEPVRRGELRIWKRPHRTITVTVEAASFALAME